MAIPAIQHLTMSNVRAEFEGGFARQNLYQVYIDNGWGTDKNGDTPFLNHLSNPTLSPLYGFTWNDTVKRLLAFSCANATIPSSTYATGEIKDNFQGVTQEFAHTRINTDIDFTFYIDRDYRVLMFFEAWMNFISGGNSDQLNEPSAYNNNISNYYRRFQYPKHYKNSTGFYIKKFEKNYITSGASNITYQLINSFPKTITTTPLQYGEAEIMTVTVTMNYDRYRIYRENFLDYASGNVVQDAFTGNASISGNTFPPLTDTFSNPTFGVDNTGQFGQTGFNITQNPL